MLSFDFSNSCELRFAEIVKLGSLQKKKKIYVNWLADVTPFLLNSLAPQQDYPCGRE